jgi:putative nucleotidyltransferase with HDIG domain
MAIDLRLFKSVLGKRIFLLFVVCALVPTVVLAIVAYRQVSGELVAQSERRMHQAVKAESLSVYERFLFLEAELESAVPSLGGGQGLLLRADGAEQRLRTLFDAVELVTQEGGATTVFGEPLAFPELQQAQRQHLLDGKTLLLTLPDGSGGGRPVLVRPVGTGAGLGLVAGVVSTDYLWGVYGEKVFLSDAELCVFDSDRRLVFGSFDACGDMVYLAGPKAVEGVSLERTVEADGVRYLAGIRNLFLRPRFGANDWTFLLCEPEAEILAPMWGFQRLFPPVVLSSLWIVLLASIYAIRRSLVPLDRLAEGTRRIASKDFSSRVEVKSGDEFEDLAGAFNDMSDRLQRQFKALGASAAIHRSILASLDTGTIVETAVVGTVKAMDCDHACIGLRVAGKTDELAATCAARDSVPATRILRARLSVWDHEVFARADGPVDLSEHEDVSGLCSSLPFLSDKGAVMGFPVRVAGDLAAVFCIVRERDREFSEEDLAQARQLADQIELALANSYLVGELRALTWGTLEAFSRAIDAKSAWTAGHSERVTKLSLKIARVMGLPREELEVLHRGALLHDVGKLGISMKVLNKPGRLDLAELEHVRTHAPIGGRILEPISAFSDIMPIVTEHHEKYDGTGYPNGLSGDAIHLMARILAVADTYDAMTSKRPYRDGFSHEEAVKEICEESGKQFDPEVVEAFLKTVIEGRGDLSSVQEVPIAEEAADGSA